MDVLCIFTAFHPDFHMLDKSSTCARDVNRARGSLYQKDCVASYTGNVHDEREHLLSQLQGTADRTGLVPAEAYNLKDKNKCARCRLLSGHFDDKRAPGAPRRQPVRLADFLR